MTFAHADKSISKASGEWVKKMWELEISIGRPNEVETILSSVMF